MVARINTSKSISKALNYNEQKVQLGKAEILEAVNFIKDADQLNCRVSSPRWPGIPQRNC